MVKKILCSMIGALMFCSSGFAQLGSGEKIGTATSLKATPAQKIQLSKPEISIPALQSMFPSEEQINFRSNDLIVLTHFDFNDSLINIFLDTDYNASRLSPAKACTLKKVYIGFVVPTDSAFVAQDCSLFVWKNSKNNIPERCVLSGTFHLSTYNPEKPFADVLLNISDFSLTFTSDFWIGYKKIINRPPFGYADTSASKTNQNLWRKKLSDSWNSYPDGNFMIAALVSYCDSTTTIILHRNDYFFGDVNVGSSADWILEVSNIGKDNVTVSEISSSEAVFTANPKTFSIAPGNMQEVILTYTPVDTGLTISTLEVKITDPYSQSLLALVGGFGIDLTPPVIEFDPASVTLPNLGNSAAIEKIVVTDNVGIAKAFLYYRKGGSSTYTPVELLTTDKRNFSGTIPPSAVTTRGLEFYIKAVDVANNTALAPATDPENHPHILSVMISNLTKPTAQPPSSYRMISVPINLDSAVPDNVLADDLFEYKDSIWRLFRWQGSDYVEYTRGSIEDFNSGKAFWLITKEAKTIDSGPGKTVTTGSNFVITLQPGWNMIGDPFDFEINWSDVVKDNSVESSLWWYDGQGYVSKTRLEPWEGYFVKNRESYNVTIEIPPRATGGLAKTLADFSALAEGEWSIQISARCGNFSDTENYLGRLNHSQTEWDQSDFSEPPQPPGDYVSLYFPHQTWDKYPGHYTADFRPMAGEGEIWDVVFDGNIAAEQGILTVSNLGSVPENLEVLLIDPARQKVIDLRANNQYQFDSNPGRQFSILVGTQQFVDKHKPDVASVPDQYALGQNYPNPFNSATTIKYEVPQRSKITLKIFNVMGQEIATLINEYQEAGYHGIHWEASQVPSGIYFYQIQAERFVQIRKMILLR